MSKEDPASIESLIQKYPGKARLAFEKGSWPALVYMFCVQCYGGNANEARECDDRHCPLWCRKMGGKFISPKYNIPDKDPKKVAQAKKMAIKGQKALKKAREKKEK